MDKYEFDLKQEKAIRSYLAKLFVLPTVVLTVAAFFLGYFINTAAHNDARVKAENKFQTSIDKLEGVVTESLENVNSAETEVRDKISRVLADLGDNAADSKQKLNEIEINARDRFQSLLAEMNEDIFESKRAVLSAEVDIGVSLENTRKLIESAEELQTTADSFKALIEADNVISEIVNNSSFQKRVSSLLKAEIEPKYYAGSGGSCVLTSIHQICWGSALADQANDKHIRLFAFRFAKGFKNKPTVTNGINADGSGYNFAVYYHGVSLDEYNGAIVETQSRNSEVPVIVNYIAIAEL